MAPRLRADGRPVDLFTGRRHAGVDISLLDLCAAQDVPLALPAADAEVHLGLDRWARDTRPERRDLAAVAADPRLRPLLLRAVGAAGHERQSGGVLDHLADHPVLGGVLREWLDGAVGELAGAVGLPGAREALNRLSPFRSVAPRVNPEALARAAGYEAAPLLGRTLRAGILDELGWPALDEALRLLDTEIRARSGNGSGAAGAGTRRDRDTALTVNEAWPCLILSRGHKAVVVGPDRILLEHDLRLPADLDRWQRPQFRYTDGELLVVWWQDGKQRGYWSSRPSEVLTLTGEQISHWWRNDDVAPSLPLPGGGRATGGRTLHAGDTVLPVSRPVIGDGTSYWRQGRQGRRHVWLEYDPATGSHSRASLPAFLRSGIDDDATLLQDRCEVLPLQPGMEHTPFGTDGVVLGRWVRAEDAAGETLTTAGTPDGRTVTLRTARHAERVTPLGALRLPGGAAPVVARTRRQIALFAPDDGGDAGVLGRVTPNERGGEFAAGTPFVPPVSFWHALRPRDERASAVLRAFTDEEAADLLRAAGRALAERQAQVTAAKAADERAGDPGAATSVAGGSAADRSKPVVPSADDVVRRTVARALPGLTDKRLLAGVTALVRTTVQIADAVTRFVTPPVEQPKPDRKRTEGMFADYRPRHGDDRTLRAAADGLARMWGSWGGEDQWTALRQIRAVNHVLSGRPADGTRLSDGTLRSPLGDGWHSDEHTVPRIGLTWPELLGVLRPLAYRATAPTLPTAEREALLLLFEALVEGPLAASGDGLREIVLGEPYDKHRQRERAGQVLRRDGRTVVVLGCQNVDTARDRVNWLALDHDPAGVFGAVAHFTLEAETRHAAAPTADALAAVARLTREKGAAPWQPEAPAALAAVTHGGVGPLQGRGAPRRAAGAPRRRRTRHGGAQAPSAGRRQPHAELPHRRGPGGAHRRPAAGRSGRAVDGGAGHGRRGPRLGRAPGWSGPCARGPGHRARRPARGGRRRGAQPGAHPLAQPHHGPTARQERPAGRGEPRRGAAPPHAGLRRRHARLTRLRPPSRPPAARGPAARPGRAAPPPGRPGPAARPGGGVDGEGRYHRRRTAQGVRTARRGRRRRGRLDPRRRGPRPAPLARRQGDRTGATGRSHRSGRRRARAARRAGGRRARQRGAGAAHHPRGRPSARSGRRSGPRRARRGGPGPRGQCSGTRRRGGRGPWPERGRCGALPAVAGPARPDRPQLRALDRLETRPVEEGPSRAGRHRTGRRGQAVPGRAFPLPAVWLARPQGARPAGGDVEGGPLSGRRRVPGRSAGPGARAVHARVGAGVRAGHARLRGTHHPRGAPPMTPREDPVTAARLHRKISR
ncbi:hypothetical protein RKD37_007470 [Streptomyces ambofaciens]